MLQASNQSLLYLRLASTTADLVPYPLELGIEDQLHVPVLLHLSMFCTQTEEEERQNPTKIYS